MTSNIGAVSELPALYKPEEGAGCTPKSEGADTHLHQGDSARFELK